MRSPQALRLDQRSGNDEALNGKCERTAEQSCHRVGAYDMTIPPKKQEKDRLGFLIFDHVERGSDVENHVVIGLYQRGMDKVTEGLV
jgi:hypothetical protein